MSVKKTLAGIASYALIGALAVGGTVAFLQDEESAMNTLAVGEGVDITIIEQQRSNGNDSDLEEFDQGKVLYPISGASQGDKDKWGMPTVEDATNFVDKIVTVKNTGQADAYVRVFVAIPTELLGESIEDDADDVLHWNYGNRVNMEGKYTAEYGDAWKTNWGWDYNVESVEFNAVIDEQDYVVTTFYFKNALSPEEATTAIMAGLYLDTNVDYDNGQYMLGDKVINYDLSKGVNVPIFADAVEAVDGVTYAKAFENREATKVFTAWAEKVTGSVVATPESGAVRPAGYAPDTAGETINNLVVVDNSDDVTNLRALYKNGLTGDITVNDSYLDGTYAMNLTVAKDKTDVDLTVNDTTLKGWVSYSGFASASFTNCTFDINSEETYKVIRPYDTTVFTNCDFAEGYEFWLDMLAEGDTLTFVNCTIGGEAMTEDNMDVVMNDVELVADVVIK